MNKQHIHHVEIKAWAEGQQIQYKLADAVVWEDIANPSWRSQVLYRVKPKTDVIYYSVLPENLMHLERVHGEFAAYGLSLTKIQTPQDKIKLTFCGETGKLVRYSYV